MRSKLGEDGSGVSRGIGISHLIAGGKPFHTNFMILVAVSLSKSVPAGTLAMIYSVELIKRDRPLLVMLHQVWLR